MLRRDESLPRTMLVTCTQLKSHGGEWEAIAPLASHHFLPTIGLGTKVITYFTEL